MQHPPQRRSFGALSRKLVEARTAETPTAVRRTARGLIADEVFELNERRPRYLRQGQ